MSHLFNSLAVLLVAGARLAAQTPAPKAIPGELACPRCVISMQILATLGTDDGIGSLIGKPMSINIDSRGRYWVFQELEPPTVFHPDGRVDRVIGRKGSGPGEFRSANSGIVIGDSMLVFDWQETRATMVGPDLKATRTIRTRHGIGDVVLLKWPTALVTVGHMQDAVPANSTMHLLSMADTSTRRIKSLGPRGTGGSMGNVAVNQTLGPAPNGFWSAYSQRPQFMLWGPDGVARASFTRRLDWYTGEQPSSPGWGKEPPTPRTAGVEEDTEGLLWFFIHTPAPTWRDAWTAKPMRVGGGSEFVIRDIGFHKLYQTYVEVIDPTQGRLLASHRINGYVMETLPGNRVALYTIDLLGIPRVQIATLTLTGHR